MTTQVYHFTDNARLPWILQSRELRPARNRIAGLPDRDFLWATDNPDRSPSASVPFDMFREGELLLVRFTLDAAGFEPWREAVARMGYWTPQHPENIERAGHDTGDDPSTWYCRGGSLPPQRWLAVEARSHDGEWTPVDPDAKPLIHWRRGLCVPLLGHALYSKRRDCPMGRPDSPTSVGIKHRHADPDPTALGIRARFCKPR
jgi:hypothetical protein